MTTDHIEAMPGDGVAESIRSAGGASVPGERDIPSVNQQRSLQNRVNNLLALIVVTLVGGGFLYFYYSNLSHKQADAKAKVVQERTAKSTGEMKLPPLGAIEGPQAAATDSTIEARPHWRMCWARHRHSGPPVPPRLRLARPSPRWRMAHRSRQPRNWPWSVSSHLLCS